jgi:methylamine utilization protein MauE
VEWAALVRAGVVVLLGTAALAKARHFHRFVDALGGYAIVPARVLPVAAAAVVAAEAALSAVLIAGVAVRGALVASAGLLLAFAAAVAVTLRRRQSLECGCLGGVLELRMDGFAVIANVGIAIAAVAASTAPVAALPLPADADGETGLVLVAWMGGVALVISYWLVVYARTVWRTIDDALTEEGT